MMKHSKIFFSLVLLLSIFCMMIDSRCSATESDSLKKSLATADSAYSKGDYDMALDIWQEYVDRGEVSANLYFDLGNAYYKKGNSGKAVISYLRALQINPNLKEAKSNLTFISGYVEDLNRAEVGNKKGNVTPDQPSFWRGLYDWVAVDHLSDTWALWAVVSFILFILCVVAYIWCNALILKKVGFFGGFLMLLLSAGFVFCAIFAAMEYNNSDKGVIIANKAELMKEPGRMDPATVPLHGGTILYIEQSRKANETVWYEVRLNSETKGWINSVDFETLKQ